MCSCNKIIKLVNKVSRESSFVTRDEARGGGELFPGRFILAHDINWLDSGFRKQIRHDEIECRIVLSATTVCCGGDVIRFLSLQTIRLYA